MRAKLHALVSAIALMITFVAGSAQAQGQPWTGYELALEGGPEVAAGRDALVRGTAYRVRGLAELVPFAGRVRARFGRRGRGSATEPWRDVRVGADGRFVAEVPIPNGAADDGPLLEIEVGPADSARTFTIPVRVRAGVNLVLRTDRRLYEPGEPVHVWALLRDEASGRPVVGETLHVRVSGGALPETTHEIVTGESGVAQLGLEIPERATESSETIEVTVPGQLHRAVSFRVGTRTYARLFATVEVEPEPVAPGGAAVVHVHLTTTSGAPVRDASVTATVDSERVYHGTTDAQGNAELPVTAPVYLVHDTGTVGVALEISHPAHGSTRANGSLRLAVPLSLEIEARPRHGAVIPEIDDVLFIRLHDGAGNPPTTPTEVSVEGAAVRNGRATATTDTNGLAEIPLRLPRGAASANDGTPHASVLVHVAGPLERSARISLPVAADADVAPTPDVPIAEPGRTVSVDLARRPRARGRHLVLELSDEHGSRLAVSWVGPRANRASVVLPSDFVGLATLSARAVSSDESLEGTGASARLIVRPADPDFVRVEPVRERWTVGETARVDLRTGVGGPRRFAAVLVRDLAAHSGEAPFRQRFLASRFEDALRSPNDETGLRLVRAAMAAVTQIPGAPRRSLPLVDQLGLPAEPDSRVAGLPIRRSMRDPWPLARELARRGVAAPMLALEELLASSLETGSLDEVTRTRGGRRRFRNDLLADQDEMRTVGGGALTPAILEAADPSFTYERVARRVARARFVHLIVALTHYLDPGDEASPAARMAAREPSARWLARMVERGIIGQHDLDDPWGNQFVLRASRSPVLVISARATALELVSPGPDGRLGTRDDVRDPFERVVPEGTPYAIASREDALMRRLAILSPTRETLRLLRESYRRVSAEMTEEGIGDAVAAGVSEGTLIGESFGFGGLGLRGTGRGGGGTGQGTIGLGSLGTIGHGGSGGLGSLAGLVRERFPPTLLFRPSMEVDPSGVTSVEIPLADAVTTYLVEAVMWRQDGWIWSNSTRIEVDREVVVEAPVPPMAHRGDAIRLPVRVANRGAIPRELRVQLVGDDSLGIAASEPIRITVPASDAIVVPFEVRPSRVGEGRLTAVVTDAEGQPIDAVRRPMRVVQGARRVTVQRMAFAERRGRIELEVPAGADARDASVQVRAGAALFATEAVAREWAAWAPPEGSRMVHPGDEIHRARRNLSQLGFAIGAGWVDERVPDRDISIGLEWLTQELDRRDDQEDERERRSYAVAVGWALLGLAPSMVGRGDREIPGLEPVIERLRRELASDALGRSDDAAVWVLAAAALGWTSPEGNDRAQVRELARRLERSAVDVGEDRWLGTERRTVRSTILYAMVQLALRRRPAAFRLLGTVARWTGRDHRLQADERGLAQAATRRLTEGPLPDQAIVIVDGDRTMLALEHGAAVLHPEALARPGVHRVEVIVEGAPVLFRATSRFGVPWDSAPAERGPVTLALDGETHGQDETAELELTVRNRTPRSLSQPIVEIELPTGAELTERERLRMGVRVERGGGVLRLFLRPMRPGNEQTIPLPLRWGLSGRLVGLGVSAYASDRPEAVSVLPPRTLEITEPSR